MYQALLVAPDGDWTCDSFGGCETVAEVESALADMGSRWYFYPFHAVITDNRGVTRDTQRLVSCAWPFEEYAGRTVRTFARAISELPEDTLRAIMEG